MIELSYRFLVSTFYKAKQLYNLYHKVSRAILSITILAFLIYQIRHVLIDLVIELSMVNIPVTVG